MNEDTMTPVFSAILVGGPPHSGKSTLVYYLTTELRNRNVPHYVLRASPDGEGDWSSQASVGLVAELRSRARDEWSPDFATSIAGDVKRRYFPLIVDAGGKISPETERIAAQCTHAIVLSADPAAAVAWRELAARHDLVLLADLHSTLTKPETVIEAGPPLRGVLSGLSRQNNLPNGPCFNALINQIAAQFDWDPAILFQIHRTLTPYELVLHLEQAIPPLTAHPSSDQWTPDQIPTLLASLPAETPLALYGRGPIWIYAALAILAAPAPCQIFNAREGWVDLPLIMLGNHPGEQTLQWELGRSDRATQIMFRIDGGHLNRSNLTSITTPLIDLDRGVILNGKLPNWLFAALARLYSPAL